MLTIEGIDRSDPDITARLFKDPDDESVVLIEPQLLNRGDWFEMKFVTDGELAKPQVDIRFAGQSAAAADLRRRRRRLSRIFTGLAVLLYIAITVYMFAVVTRFLPDYDDPVPVQLWFALGGIVILMVLFGAGKFWTNRLGWRSTRSISDDEDWELD